MYGGGMKDVKIEMSEADSRLKRRERERGEGTEQYYRYYKLCIYFWNKKESNTYWFGVYFPEEIPFSWAARQTSVPKHYFLHMPL